MADFSANTDVNTSSLEHLVGKTVDTVLNYSPATLFFLGNQKQWKGSQLRIPIKYTQNTNGTSFDGLDKFSTTKANNFVKMTFNPTGREMPVVISQIEADVNQAGGKIVDLVARQMESDAQDMASDIAEKFYTLQTGKEFLSLTDACDDANLGATSYGGLARSTYTGLQGNLTQSIGALSLTDMRTAVNGATHGANTPNLIITTKAVWQYYEALLIPTLTTRVEATALNGYSSFVGASMNGLPNITAPGSQTTGTQGFNAIYYSGIPLVADEDCTAGYMFGLNTRSIAFHGLKSTDPDYQPVSFASGGGMDSVYSVPSTTGFAFSGFNKPIDQYGKVGHIILMGNLVCDNPRLNFLMTDITS